MAEAVGRGGGGGWQRLEIIFELVYVYSYKVSSDWSGSLSNTFVASDWSVIFSI